jgi:hypothetical protein
VEKMLVEALRPAEETGKDVRAVAAALAQEPGCLLEC